MIRLRDMDEQTADKIISVTYWPRAMVSVALGLLALFLLVGTFTELSGRLATSGKTAANVERFMLDVWDAIVEARRTKEAAEFAEQVNG